MFPPDEHDGQEWRLSESMVKALRCEIDFDRDVMQEDLQAWVEERFPPGLIYSAPFCRQAMVAYVAMGDRLLKEREQFKPRTTAEEIMLWALLDSVEVSIAESGLVVEGDVEEMRDLLYEDWDHRFLFDPKNDGIELEPVAERLGFVNLEFAKWFEPFRAELPA